MQALPLHVGPIYIYSLVCNANGKKYIGQTRDLRRRWDQHQQRPPALMRPDVERFGPCDSEHFTMRTIATACSQVQADRVERELISVLGTLAPNGYNRMVGPPGIRDGFTGNERVSRLLDHLLT